MIHGPRRQPARLRVLVVSSHCWSRPPRTLTDLGVCRRRQGGMVVARAANHTVPMACGRGNASTDLRLGVEVVAEGSYARPQTCQALPSRHACYPRLPCLQRLWGSTLHWHWDWRSPILFPLPLSLPTRGTVAMIHDDILHWTSQRLTPGHPNRNSSTASLERYGGIFRRAGSVPPAR